MTDEDSIPLDVILIPGKSSEPVGLSLIES